MQSIKQQASKEALFKAIAVLNLCPSGQFKYTEALTIAQLTQDPSLAYREATLPLTKEAKAQVQFMRRQLQRSKENKFSKDFIERVARDREGKALEEFLKWNNAQKYFAYCIAIAMGNAIKDGLVIIPFTSTAEVVSERKEAK